MGLVEASGVPERAIFSVGYVYKMEKRTHDTMLLTRTYINTWK